MVACQRGKLLFVDKNTIILYILQLNYQ